MLETLRRIAQDVSAARGVDEALSVLVRHVHKVMKVDVCSVYLTDPASGRHVLTATQGLAPDAVNLVRLEPSQGLVGLVAEHAEAVNLDDAPSHPRFLFVPDSGEEPYHGFVGVPIVHQRRVLGVLVVQHEEVRRFEESDVAFLVTLAAQLSGGIAHAQASGALNLGGQGEDRGDPYITGFAGAPGVAMGTGVVVGRATRLSEIPDRRAVSRTREEAAFRSAVRRAVEELESLYQSLNGTLPEEDRALFDAYSKLAGSQSIMDATLRGIHAGNWAPGALRDAIAEHARPFEQMSDSYLRQRAEDIRELGRRILMHLQNSRRTQSAFPPRSILVGEQVSPIELAEVPPGRLAGVVSGRGSVSSHLAILARAMGVPAVVGVGDVSLAGLEGRDLILDGYDGRVYVEPGMTVHAEYTRLAREERQLARDLKALRDLPAETPDGERVTLCVNTALSADVAAAAQAGADGIGLYRTEFPFMIQQRFPSEEEQRATYRQVLEAFAPRPVALRTLDVGGDKPLPYLPVEEENPFLGWRGIRVTLDHPEFMVSQVRAAIRASIGLDNLTLLMPMISRVSELDDALAIIHHTYRALRREGEGVTMPKTGVLIEVPSAAIQAEALARRVDILSVGTNDLTQYLLAVDRNNERVAQLYDSLHPALIRTLMQVVEAAHRAGRQIGVCGEAAGDPAAALLLLGMGFDSLSVTAFNLPRIKRVIRSFTRTQAKHLLENALEYENPEPIRASLNAALEAADLGSLIRAGR